MLDLDPGEFLNQSSVEQNITFLGQLTVARKAHICQDFVLLSYQLLGKSFFPSNSFSILRTENSEIFSTDVFNHVFGH